MIDDKVTVRSSNITELTRQSRSRHHTDDSSLGSFKFEVYPPNHEKYFEKLSFPKELPFLEDNTCVKPLSLSFF